MIINTKLARLWAIGLLISVVAFTGLVTVVRAQVGSETVTEDDFTEIIHNFSSDIVVNPDGTITVTETIEYDFKDQERHGIYRDINLTKIVGTTRKLEVDVIDVQDEKGNPYLFDVSGRNPIRVKVGDPDVTLSGMHVYKITYLAKNAIGRFDDRDEIYWNATGTDWTVPMWSAEAHVFLPGNLQANSLHIASYCGLEGIKDPCISTEPLYDTETNRTEVAFFSDESVYFDTGEGMTIAVGFPKGTVAAEVPYTFWEKMLNWLNDHWFYPMPLVVVALWYRKSFQFWLRRRTYYKQNTVVAEYDAGEMDPLETAGVVNGGIANENLSAQIIYLAVRGYIKIKSVDDEFTFIQTEKVTDGLTAYDKKLLENIAGKSQTDLINTFYPIAGEVRSTVAESLIIRNYVERSGFATKVNWNGNPALIKLFLSIFLAINPGIFIWFFAGWKFGVIFSVSCILIGLISIITNPRTSKLTDKGLEAERKLLGLKLYISVAEEERIKFHNAPAKNPEIFEKLLPYAMVFGLEQKWAKEFEGIYTVPPQWYSDSSMSTFSAVALASSLNHFSASATSAMFSAPASYSSGGSSGSSGGGSSGGGGGGGGGGSW